MTHTEPFHLSVHSGLSWSQDFVSLAKAEARCAGLLQYQGEKQLPVQTSHCCTNTNTTRLDTVNFCFRNRNESELQCPVIIWTSKSKTFFPKHELTFKNLPLP